ncbi:MAG: hypothetical protein M3O70_10135 [Actinomycetota bacterium]|nr:hypothetical protein [Actinomycetota bacterium]
MDSDAMFMTIRELTEGMFEEMAIADSMEIYTPDAVALAEHVQALDHWLSKGGKPPRDWMVQ